ncbi:MAG TPA: hypothetical protein VE615_05140 [Gaiellaceae bacterium]|nr:hypothetical protein [Gaiellaceae bacterium]
MGGATELAGDLTPEAVAASLPGRPIHAFPALLSTDADALAWARAGAPDGAVVVSEYQASPRGRAGIEWSPAANASLVFSLVVRQRLPAEREGWLYVAASTALADALGEGAATRWPDEVWRDGERAAAVGVFAQVVGPELAWAVITVLLQSARPPRAPLLAAAVESLERRIASPTTPVLADYLRRCETIGTSVRARMVPLGPGGLVVSGTARNVKPDGALVVEADDGRRLAVRAPNLGLLEQA